MPNHTSNRLVMYGPREVLNEIQKGVREQEGLANFAIPKPEELKDTVSPTYVLEELTSDKSLERIWDRLDDAEKMAHIDPQIGERLESWRDFILEKEQPRIDRLKSSGQAIPRSEAMRRLREYGAVNWYDWAVENWGTKWGDYDGSWTEIGDETFAYFFYSAWSPPLPAIDALSSKYPAVSMHLRYFDEGWSYHGHASWHNGIRVQERDMECPEPDGLVEDVNDDDAVHEAYVEYQQNFLHNAWSLDEIAQYGE